MYDAGVSPPGEGEERAQATGGAAEAPARAGVDRLGKRRRVERLAVGYFKRRAGVGMGARPLHGDAVHFLNPEERRNLRRIERNAVLRAGIDSVEHGTYIDENTGDVTHFRGREVITTGGAEVYALDYFGGLIRP